MSILVTDRDRSTGRLKKTSTDRRLLCNIGMKCVAACCNLYCSVLWCVAVCCSVLRCVAVCCGVLQCVAVCCSVLQCVAVCCSALQCAAVSCGVSQFVAVCCAVLLLMEQIRPWWQEHGREIQI